MNRAAVALFVFAFACANPSVPLDSSATGNATTTNPTGPGAGGAGGSGGSGGAPPDGPWINSTSNLAGMESICGVMGWVSAKPDQDMLIAGIAVKGLWASTDGGASWTALGSAAGSAAIDNRPHSIVYDPTTPSRFWQSGIYEGHGVFETKDDGSAFEVLGDIRHCDLVAVDFSDPARQLLLAGGHEQDQTLYRTTDGGMNWTNIGMMLPAGRGCTWPLILDTMTHLIGCGAPFGGGGVLRTTDGAMTWTEVGTTGGASAPLRASDGTIYWASPVGHVMVHSTDNGLTWTESPTLEVGYVSPIELPDGTIAALNSEYIMLTSDHAMTWRKLVALPFNDATGLTYSTQRKAIYVWHSACGTGVVPVPADAIMRYDYAPP
jgi:hypothetical protein